MENPFIKLLLFLSFTLLSVKGNLISVGLGIAFCLILILISNKKDEFVFVSFIFLVIMLSSIVLITIPGGTWEDIISSLETAARLALVIVSALFFFVYSNVVEIIYLMNKMKVNPYIGYSIGIGFRYIPIILNDSQRVVLAQRSRGMKFSIFKLKKIKIAIESLIIPMLNSILRRIYMNLIAMKVRRINPEDKVEEYKYKTTLFDYFSIIFSLVLWAMTMNFF